MGIIDMHCDTISELLKHKRSGENYGGLRKNLGHIDLEKLKKSDYLVQNFAMYVCLRDVDDPWDEVEAMMDLYDEEVNNNQDVASKILTFGDIRAAKEAGKVGCMMTVEEGGVCKGEMSKLDELYRRGVRMLTLTWNFSNGIGFPNFTLSKDKSVKPDFTIPNTKDGLTEFGKEFVEHMEELGMIVDVSHLSDAGFYDVVDITKKPFVASHSNARAVASNVRNLTDDMIRKLADHGGITGINFCKDFLDDLKREDKNHGSIDAMIRHIRHLVNVGGIDCVGLGTDFDGIGTNPHIPNAGEMPRLVDALHKNGFTSDEIDRILFQNALRVYREIL